MHSNHLQTSSCPSGTLSREGAFGARREYQTKCCSRCDRFGLEVEAISPLFSQLFPDHREVRLSFVSYGLEKLRGSLVPFVDLSVHLSGPLGDKTLFDFSNEPYSDSLPLVFRLHREVIDPTSSSVPASHYTPNDPIVLYSD